MKKLNPKILTLISIIILLSVFLFARLVWGWTNPSANPPSGGGALYYSGGNVGIGTTAPAEKLEVSGNIKLSGVSATYKITNVVSPTADSDMATKAYVDAAGTKTWYKTLTTANGAAASTLCAAGYHMCYPGEWLSRKWDTSLGDAGDTWVNAVWVDMHSNNNSTVKGDCLNWTSADVANYGATTYVFYSQEWPSAGTAYNYEGYPCSYSFAAFCCQD